MKKITRKKKEIKIEGINFNIKFGIPNFGNPKDEERVCLFSGNIYVRPLNGKGYFKNLKVCNKALSKGEYTISK